MRQHTKQLGFTIVELLIVIVVIGILATISIVAYSGISKRANVAAAVSDLHNAATLVETKYVETGQYAVTMPPEIKTSANIVLQLANTGNNNSMCINAYSTKDPSIRMSWDTNRGGLQTMLCDGVTIGSPSGGAVPAAPRNQNLVADFSRWTLSGGATYDSTTKELTLGANGYARSPISRVDSPYYISIGADLYAVNSSPYSGFTPQAGYHTGINYFASDGVTPVMNSANYTSNGCARPFPTGTWKVGDQQCGYFGGPNVIYSSFTFTGSSGTYASSDLKLSKPLMIVTD
ncbi:prepilin-type N-terminal cleavage/methylation domain-containing protein [Candidatus Saccharibacteria bacterium]|nr:prepilin-type N-terminal cleavage/methylation domain-containing protein [Candidatus Saccharibacteria bacterium]